jgi:hypothetical protein
MKVSQTEQAVRHWLATMVVGEGLCPFAAAPLARGQVRVAVCGESDTDAIYRYVLAELDRLLQADPVELETTLVAVPEGLEDFAVYLEMLAFLEDALQQLALEGTVQIASFHPEYVFEGVDAEDVGNYTNRSPCALFHLIREDSLSRALASYPDPQNIPRRNQQRMRELGLQRIRQLLGLSGGLASRD